MTYLDLVAALFPGGAPDDLKAHALILDATAAQAMQAAQDVVASEHHKVQPVETTDGRYLISADILAELAPGGLFEAALPHFNMQALAGVEVLPWADGLALLPVPDVEIV